MALKTEREKVAHLLRRFGLGASEAEVAYYGEKGLKGAIDRLLNYEETPDNWVFTLDLMRNDKGQVSIPVTQSFWYSRLLTTNRPLQEKMTLFWHDHFATSAMKVDVPEAMDNHIEILRKGALGKFGDLLLDVSKDPAMLYWLDNNRNTKGRPNENFAREVMELFTLGIGHYSEKDVQEAARAFTGWTFIINLPNGKISKPNKPTFRTVFAMDEAAHDTGVKKILGKTGDFNGDEVLALLCQNPQTARNIVTKMWEWFAHPQPGRRLVEKLTGKFIASGLDIKILVRAIMESPEFYSEESEKGYVKSPVDFCVSTARAFGVGRMQLQILMNLKQETVNPLNLIPVALGVLLLQTTRSMGMTLMMPPDVAGWNIGEGWISSATMVERMKWSDKLFAVINNRGKAPRASLLLDVTAGQYFYGMLGQEQDPERIVSNLLVILDGDALLPRKEPLVRAAAKISGGVVTEINVVRVVQSVTKAVFGSPEYQFG